MDFLKKHKKKIIFGVVVGVVSALVATGVIDHATGEMIKSMFVGFGM